MLTMIVKSWQKKFIPAIADKIISKTTSVSAFLLAGLEYSNKGYKTIKL